MATRCNVVVKNNVGETSIVYRHCDGYPESVLPALEPILSKIKTTPKDFQWNAHEYGGLKITNLRPILVAHDIVKIEESYFIGNNQRTYRPFEFTTDIHGDIEYLYTLNADTGELEYEKVR